jgi:hypothetical protein
MKTPKKRSKRYNLSYKEKYSSKDPYLPKGAKGNAVCECCSSVYRNKRWYADKRYFKEGVKKRELIKIVCPACLKMRDNFPGGILTLKGKDILLHKKDLMNLIRNEEERARGLNPLERIMSIKEDGYGNIIISTTNEKLAQRLGREIKKAFHGKVFYQWSHDNKLLRVDWMGKGMEKIN